MPLYKLLQLKNKRNVTHSHDIIFVKSLLSCFKFFFVCVAAAQAVAEGKSKYSFV